MKNKLEAISATTLSGAKIKIIDWYDEAKSLVWCEIESREKNYQNSISIKDINLTDEVKKYLKIKG